jgi:hypothetical protein
VVDALKGMKLKYPKLSAAQQAGLAQARQQLEGE